MPRIFHPEILSTFRAPPRGIGYSRAQLLRDLLAGVTVGFVALPLALALGIGSIDPDVARAAGVSPPVAGLMTAIVAGFLISALGGARVCVGGPTAAFVVIVASIAQQHGFAGLGIATIMAGLILIFLGVTKMGALIKFIPYPVTTGFTTGIGFTILVGQIKDLAGLRPLSPDELPVPTEFIHKIHWYATHLSAVHWPTLIVGVVCTLIIYLWPKVGLRRVPGPIIVLIGATLVTSLFNLPLETIGDRFGALPTSLPAPSFPTFDWTRATDLVGPAFTIALLAAIESLLCAVVADGMLGTRHRSNTELIAQGVANVASPLFGGIPATGAIARTATNIQSGARTPLAGIIHAVTLLAILLLAGRFAELVPLCVLAAVLVVVAWNMAELHRFQSLLRGPRQDAAVLLCTFLLTVLTDLTIAVGVGVVLAALLFMKRMADLTNVGAVAGDSVDIRQDLADTQLEHAKAIPGVEIYDINGPFFFGAAYKLRETLDALGKPPRVLILNMRNVLAMDSTGLHALEELRRRCEKDGTRLIIAGIHAQPVNQFARKGLLDAFGDQNLVGTIEDGLYLARAMLASSPAR